MVFFLKLVEIIEEGVKFQFFYDSFEMMLILEYFIYIQNKIGKLLNKVKVFFSWINIILYQGYF